MILLGRDDLAVISIENQYLHKKNTTRIRIICVFVIDIDIYYAYGHTCIVQL